MKRNLLLECAWILPRTNNKDLAFVCEGYMDHAYDLFKQNDPNLNKQDFFNTLFKLAEEDTEDNDPFNCDTNKEIKEYDKTSRVPKKERERLVKEYHNKKKISDRAHHGLTMFV